MLDFKFQEKSANVEWPGSRCDTYGAKKMSYRRHVSLTFDIKKYKHIYLQKNYQIHSCCSQRTQGTNILLIYQSLLFIQIDFQLIQINSYFLYSHPRVIHFILVLPWEEMVVLLVDHPVLLLVVLSAVTEGEVVLEVDVSAQDIPLNNSNFKPRMEFKRSNLIKYDLKIEIVFANKLFERYSKS